MKKIISIMLALVLMASMASVAVSAISVFEDGVLNVEEAVKMAGVTETRRYYFMMPDGIGGRTDPTTGLVAPSWYNEFATCAGIYWWGGSAIPSGTAEPGSTDGVWAGYAAMPGDAPNVFYADVPKDVTVIVWNNGVDGGTDDQLPIYFKAAQSVNTNVEWFDPGEDVNWPNGIPEEEGFDNKIFIVYPEESYINDYSGKQTCGGHWFYYYSEGCYGLVDPATADMDADCMNPDHRDADGKHTGSDEEESFVLGDADMDGDVTIYDATKIQRYLAELLDDVSEIDLRAAKIVDPDADEPSIYDVTRIQRFLAELCMIDGSDWVG